MFKSDVEVAFSCSRKNSQEVSILTRQTSFGKGDPTHTQERAVELMLEKLELVRQIMAEDSTTKNDILLEEPLAYYANISRFNYSRFFKVNAKEKMSVILQAEEHILGVQNGKERFIKEVALLSQTFALSVPNEQTLAYKDEIAFMLEIKGMKT